MQVGAPAVERRRVWLRGLLFSVVAAPLLGALLTTATLLIVKLRQGAGLPPSVPLVIAVGVTVAYIVAAGPALVAGLLYTWLALHWQSEGLSRSAIALRLGVAGIALGLVAGVIAGSLGEGELVVGPLYLGPGAVTGSLMGLVLPRALWGAADPY
jgi:hypothetical protein